MTRLRTKGQFMIRLGNKRKEKPGNVLGHRGLRRSLGETEALGLSPVPMPGINASEKAFRLRRFIILEKQRRNSCLIFEVVPLAGGGGWIYIFFRNERALEKDARMLPALRQLS